MSYPWIESFVASNFIKSSYRLEFGIGKDLNKFLHDQQINQSKITEESLTNAVVEMEHALLQFGVPEYDLDHFADTNLRIFDLQEENYTRQQKYKLLSLLCLMLLDLGLVWIEREHDTAE